MKLKVNRYIFGPKSTIGELFIDGLFFCYTLEDAVRPEGVKIDGQTAIPYGTYKVILDYSNRFGKVMPHILDVPNFTGVRIHSGNTSKDTEGCLLLGYTKETDDLIGRSHDALNDFIPALEKGLKDGDVTIEVTK